MSGCIGPAPHKEAVTPAISGVVIDSETKAPIEGVSVFLTPGDSFGILFTDNIIYEKSSQTVATDVEGVFYLPPHKDWYFWVHPYPKSSGFGAVHEFLLQFNHPNYKSYTYSWMDTFASWEKIPPLNLGDIELVRK